MLNSTDELLAKVDALAAKGRAASQLAVKAKQGDRQELWARLKKESPDTAKLLTRVAAVFGKPSGLSVKFEADDTWIDVS